MDNMLKTKDVADQLGVSQKTVRRWMKQFHIKCEVNEAGHFLFNEEQYRQLKIVHERVNAGKVLSEISLSNEDKQDILNPMISSEELDERFNRLLFQIELLDRKIQSKAEDVVEIQTFQHRREIDEITESLEQFNNRLNRIEQTLNNEADKLINLQTKSTEIERMKKGKLASMFSL
ncbi:MerR family transcriptional regulator [Evansella sp. AB-P1]|uniref:MerR family transcriptional regulator n=1 Tax=Evansella sp. AB-P1 TaxID=3037653 RepID=UPI00241C2DCB|nr:MerR family transcriptional regulator [Evansella sp. AB-P1]MDG5787549.1 MerR family transcriptional regulator [Evansella sp. AB-P1]